MDDKTNKELKQRNLDTRYMRMATIWAENSYCKRRQVGALLVKDKMIISDGYNGTPSGFDNNEFLVSAGLGMRLAITKYAQIKCDIAFPCADGNNEEDNDMEVYFGAQVQF